MLFRTWGLRIQMRKVKSIPIHRIWDLGRFGSGALMTAVIELWVLSTSSNWGKNTQGYSSSSSLSIQRNDSHFTCDLWERIIAFVPLNVGQRQVRTLGQFKWITRSIEECTCKQTQLVYLFWTALANTAPF